MGSGRVRSPVGWYEADTCRDHTENRNDQALADAGAAVLVVDGGKYFLG
jgi:hypothetical protein